MISRGALTLVIFCRVRVELQAIRHTALGMSDLYKDKLQPIEFSEGKQPSRTDQFSTCRPLIVHPCHCKRKWVPDSQSPRFFHFFQSAWVAVHRGEGSTEKWNQIVGFFRRHVRLILGFYCEVHTFPSPESEMTLLITWGQMTFSTKDLIYLWDKRMLMELFKSHSWRETK